MVIFLGQAGHTVNRKRVQRLMRLMGLAGMAPSPGTSRRHPAHKVHPYLLRGVAVARPKQVWSTDITYIRLPRGFAYLVAVIDWDSRKVLGWRISNSTEAIFCVDCLEEALRTHGKPEAFTDVLARKGVVISMDGRGRVFDHIFVERLWRSVKRGGKEPPFRYAPQGDLSRRSKINCNSTKQSKTGAAPSSCD